MTPSSPSQQKIYVSLFCTHCGNRSGVDPGTRERVALIIKLERRDLPVLAEDIATIRCVDCNGPMDVKVLGHGSDLTHRG